MPTEGGGKAVDGSAKDRREVPAEARRFRPVGALALPPVGFLIVFAGLPIAFSLLLILGHLGGPNAALSQLGQGEIAGHGVGTLQAIKGVITNTGFGQSLVATLVVVALSSIIVLAAATALSLWHRLAPTAATAALVFLGVVPLFIPVVISSFALWSFWGDRGFADSLAAAFGVHHGLVLSATLKGVVVAEVWVSLPFAVLLLRAALAALPSSSLEAARDAGASNLAVARRIVLPQIRRECTVVFCFSAVGILGSFTVPYIIGPASPLLLGVDAVDTFNAFNRPQQAAVIGFVIFVLAGFIGAIYALGTHQRRSRRA
ncbi:MAG: ABC transporter permease [Acidimicrobiales bacterium]